MIEFRDVSIHFGTQDVLDTIRWQINLGERIGVVGPNGAGKSTLFSLIVGDLTPFSGEVVVRKGIRIGYVRQQLPKPGEAESLLDFASAAVAELPEIERRIHEVESEMAEGNALRMDLLLRELGELQSAFEHLGAYDLRSRAEAALCGLGFAPDSVNNPLASFSGGWRMRAELARSLIAEPDVLLLDEPSNYLDLPAVEWLERYLEEFRGTLVLISHDRFLLNSLTTITLEVANGRVERYSGNYDYYARERTKRYESRLAAQKNQDRKREQLERFIERFKSKSTLAAQAQSRVKQLARLEKIELPKIVETSGHIRLRPPPHCGAEVVRLESAGLTYDGQRWVLRGVDFSVVRGEKLALVGYNGMGKTTLLRMLAGQLAPSEGRRVLGHKVLIGYQSQDFAETMDPHNTVFNTIKSIAGPASVQEVRGLLGGFGFPGDTIEKQVGVLSGGEKIRLAFARLLMNPPNFLILDEPTTHLDIQAREALENALVDYQGTICMVSHDIDFVKKVANGIVAMTPPGVTRYAGGYEYYHEKMSSAQTSVFSGKKGVQGGSEIRNPKSEAGGVPRQPVTDKKELRKQRALERQALYDQTKELKKALHQAEKQVALLEPERSKVLAELADPAQVKDFMALNRKLLHIEEDIQRYTAQWEKAATELEKVEGKAKVAD